MCQSGVDHDECVSMWKVSLMVVSLWLVLVCAVSGNMCLKLALQFDIISNTHQVYRNMRDMFIVMAHNEYL